MLSGLGISLSNGAMVRSKWPHVRRDTIAAEPEHGPLVGIHQLDAQAFRGHLEAHLVAQFTQLRVGLDCLFNTTAQIDEALALLRRQRLAAQINTRLLAVGVGRISAAAGNRAGAR